MSIRESGTNYTETIRDALQHGIQRLSASGQIHKVPAEIEAQTLLRCALGLTADQMTLDLDSTLSKRSRRIFSALVSRRCSGEPLEYIVGRCEFMSLEFLISEGVRVPQYETSFMVEHALSLLQYPTEGIMAADVGTGSGAIAISLAAQRPELRILATDISATPICVARTNAWRILGRDATRVMFVQCNLLSALRASFHIVLANLPYVPTHELGGPPHAPDEQKHREMIDGGSDGLDVYRSLLQDIDSKIHPGGWLLMKCRPSQAEILKRLGAEAIAGGRAITCRDRTGTVWGVEVTKRGGGI